MIKILCTLALLLSTTALAEETVEVDKDRLVKVYGAINKNILKQAKELMALSKDSSDDIYIHINSGGGSIRAGKVFITAMEIAQARGVEIHCVSTLLAASMAFTILAECDHRYVLKSTELLYHQARVLVMFAALSSRQLEGLYQNLRGLDEELLKFLYAETGIDPYLLSQTYYAEKLWTATDLNTKTTKGWLTIVDNIEGLDDVFAHEAEVTQSPKSVQHYTHEMEEHGYVIIQ